MKRLLLILWLLTAAAGSRISAAGRTELNQGWKFRQYGLGEWLPAAVPGTVHTDLLANGQIPDPFYGSSQSDLQWIDKTDWEYCCTFDAPELASYDNVRLVFEGVDCYADIRLNGELLHRTGNMFRTWKSDGTTACTSFFTPRSCRGSKTWRPTAAVSPPTTTSAHWADWAPTR